MKLVIFSRGPNLYSTRRLVEAADSAGHEVRVLDHTLCMPSLVEGRHALITEGRITELPDVAIPRIGTNVTARGVAIIRQLDVLGVKHTMPAEALLLARDKMSSLQVLAAGGIDVPRTFLCFSTAEARHAAKRLGPYPIIVKLLESTHGIGVGLARNSFQFERLIDGFLRLQDCILVQEYIEESKGTDVRALVVGDEIVAVMERKAAHGEFRANIHRGASARQLTLDEETKALVLKCARTIGVEIAGVDLINSSRGYLPMEINASPGLEGIEGATGVDVAGAIIKHAAAKV